MTREICALTRLHEEELANKGLQRGAARERVRVGQIDDAKRAVRARASIAALEVPRPNLFLVPNSARDIPLNFATASFAHKDFPAAAVVEKGDPASRGWAVGPRLGESHSLAVLPVSTTVVSAGDMDSPERCETRN